MKLGTHKISLNPRKPCAACLEMRAKMKQRLKMLAKFKEQKQPKVPK